MGKITKEQMAIIDSFICERLSYKEENKELIKNFTNKRNNSLVSTLQKDAWDEDRENMTAFYVIKSPDDEIAMFFSLRCGALFHSLNEEFIEQDSQKAQKILQAIQKINIGEEDPRILEPFKAGRNITVGQLIYEAKKAKQKFSIIYKDKMRENNEQIIRVKNTYSGIELVHFCSNDLIRKKWKSLGLNYPMGEVMFWKYITPIMCEIQKYAGCQYAFLFAADLSENGSLINYYNVALKFYQPKELGTSKPFYDMCCTFMCQEINELKKYRQEFFDNFNPSEDDIVI